MGIALSLTAIVVGLAAPSGTLRQVSDASVVASVASSCAGATTAAGDTHSRLEAMYCGAPVVAADCPSGAAEILDDGAYGALVPVDDADALAAAIIEVFREMPPAQRERAQQYNVGRSVEAYLRLLEAR